MIKALIYSREGYPVHSTVDDPRLVSELDEVYAIETWQVGIVRAQLAIRTKTVESISRLLERTWDGTMLEVCYQPQAGSPQLQHTVFLRRLGRRLQPVLVPTQLPSPSDPELVALLKAGLGEYIRVSYRLLDRRAAAVVPRDPLRQLTACTAEKVMVAEG